MVPVAQVSSTDFRQNFGTYIRLVEQRDFEVTKNGRVVALWTSPNRDRLALCDRLAGSIHAEIDEKADREERIAGI